MHAIGVRNSKQHRTKDTMENSLANFPTFDVERWRGVSRRPAVEGVNSSQYRRDPRQWYGRTSQQQQHQSIRQNSIVSNLRVNTTRHPDPKVDTAPRGRDMTGTNASAKEETSAWRTATCPNTGKTYYWNIHTRESRWKKPAELASAAEKNAIKQKEAEQKEFFAQMEANILKKFSAVPSNNDGFDCLFNSSGSLTSCEASVDSDLGSGSPGGDWFSEDERDDKVPPLGKDRDVQRLKHGNRPIIDKPSLIRTISKMEYDLANQLRTPAMTDAIKVPLGEETVRNNSEHFSNILSSLQLTQEASGVGCILTPKCRTAPASPTTPDSTMGHDAQTPLSTKSAGASPREDLAKPAMTKRNTCGTLYLASTLSAPDKDALIKCVCGVYRAHLLQSQIDEQSASLRPSSKYDQAEVFNDDLKIHPRHARRYQPTVDGVPSLDEVTAFYRDIFLRSQMENDCIIISLIYVERLIKKTEGRVRPNVRNWRSVLFSCMVLSSKVWDDLSMWNCDFSKIGPSGVAFSLQRTNELEVSLLSSLDYSVKVNAGEYAKYYFLLRSMLCRSGLANDSLASLNPLDAEGVKSLEKTGACCDSTISKTWPLLPLVNSRSKSYGDAATTGKRFDSKKAIGTSPQSQATKKVSLEQLVRM